jgi:hypothetical protein
MVKLSKSGKKTIAAGGIGYQDPVKKKEKTAEQLERHAQQKKDAKKRQTERFKQMDKGDPKLVQRQKNNRERMAR